MSKKPLKTKINVDPSGLSWQDVIALDPTHIRGLSEKSLAKLTSRLVSAYNKRAKRLEQSGIAEASPAYRGLMQENKTRLSVKGKNYNELLSTYADAKRLLTERSTFSVSGTRDLIKRTADRIGHDFKDQLESQKFWGTIDRLKERNIGNDNRTSTDVQREVADMLFNEGASLDDVLKHYEVVVESNTPDINFETGELFDFGGEDGEEFEFEEGDDTDW